MGAVELPRRIAKLFATDFRRVGLGPRLTAAVVEVHDGKQRRERKGRGSAVETKKQNLPRGRRSFVLETSSVWILFREFRFQAPTVITLSPT